MAKDKGNPWKKPALEAAGAAIVAAVTILVRALVDIWKGGKKK